VEDKSPNIHVSERQVTTVSPRDTTEITLRLMDWRRIYRKVNSICPFLSKRELFSGVAWGVTGSALITLITISQPTQTSPPDSWVKPTLWAIAAGSLIIGCVIWFAGKRESANVEIVKGEILQDMKDIHLTYFPTDDLDGQ
jgi:hypothetical protein